MRVPNIFSLAVIILFFGYFGGRLLLAEILPFEATELQVESVALKASETIKPAMIKAKSRVAKKRTLGKPWYAICSYYADRFHGKPMACGKPFDMYDSNIAAHRDLPFGTKLELTNLKNGKKLVVTIFDRGPFTTDKKTGKFIRDLDLSYAGAIQLGFKENGTAQLIVKKIH